jgi:hypothetical protein
MQSAKFPGNFELTPFLVGSVYSLICMLGVFAAFYPKKCQRTFMFQKNIKASSDLATESNKIHFSGHHPECPKFSPNRIRIRKKAFCAACSGLVVGAAVVLAGTIMYFFMGFNFLGSNPQILFLSNSGLILGLFQFRLVGYLKLGLNGLFVICSFVSLAIADLITESLLVDLYVLGLVVFLLYTRILLSEWNNSKICKRCNQCF